MATANDQISDDDRQQMIEVSTGQMRFILTQEEYWQYIRTGIAATSATHDSLKAPIYHIRQNRRQGRLTPETRLEHAKSVELGRGKCPLHQGQESKLRRLLGLTQDTASQGWASTAKFKPSMLPGLEPYELQALCIIFEDASDCENTVANYAQIIGRIERRFQAYQTHTLIDKQPCKHWSYCSPVPTWEYIPTGYEFIVEPLHTLSAAEPPRTARKRRREAHDEGRDEQSKKKLCDSVRRIGQNLIQLGDRFGSHQAAGTPSSPSVESTQSSSGSELGNNQDTFNVTRVLSKVFRKLHKSFDKELGTASRSRSSRYLATNEDDSQNEFEGFSPLNDNQTPEDLAPESHHAPDAPVPDNDPPENHALDDDLPNIHPPENHVPDGHTANIDDGPNQHGSTNTYRADLVIDSIPTTLPGQNQAGSDQADMDARIDRIINATKPPATTTAPDRPRPEKATNHPKRRPNFIHTRPPVKNASSGAMRPRPRRKPAARSPDVSSSDLVADWSATTADIERLDGGIPEPASPRKSSKVTKRGTNSARKPRLTLNLAQAGSARAGGPSRPHPQGQNEDAAESTHATHSMRPRQRPGGQDEDDTRAGRGQAATARPPRAAPRRPLRGPHARPPRPPPSHAAPTDTTTTNINNPSAAPHTNPTAPTTDPTLNPPSVPVFSAHPRPRFPLTRAAYDHIRKNLKEPPPPADPRNPGPVTRAFIHTADETALFRQVGDMMQAGLRSARERRAFAASFVLGQAVLYHFNHHLVPCGSAQDADEMAARIERDDRRRLHGG